MTMPAARMFWCALGLLPAIVFATDSEDWNAHGQLTYVRQAKPAFDAPYDGPNSLRSARELSWSVSATLALGWRPWQGGELYVNPEMIAGLPLSGLHGLGGVANGELQKSAGTDPTFYRARIFLRQTWGFGDEAEAQESAANQLAGTLPKRRLVLTAGNLSITDLFDANAYAHDARSQFMNTTFVANGAFDYASDARGYSWGAVLEWVDGDWAIRAGRFLQPDEANGLPLDYRPARHYGDQVEVERGYMLGGREGRVRLLAFRSRAFMGSFRSAIAAAGGGIPDVTAVRTERSKHGFGLNIEQALTDSLGLFARASWNDGESETYAFAEIDRSLSAGLRLDGAAFGRAGDAIGLAYARNGLSAAHRDYLAAGGLGGFLGDGRLRYAPESILEAYYSVALGKASAITIDLQRIAHPGDNGARGPANFAAVRLHTEF